MIIPMAIKSKHAHSSLSFLLLEHSISSISVHAVVAINLNYHKITIFFETISTHRWFIIQALYQRRAAKELHQQCFVISCISH